MSRNPVKKLSGIEADDEYESATFLRKTLASSPNWSEQHYSVHRPPIMALFSRITSCISVILIFMLFIPSHWLPRERAVVLPSSDTMLVNVSRGGRQELTWSLGNTSWFLADNPEQIIPKDKNGLEPCMTYIVSQPSIWYKHVENISRSPDIFHTSHR